MGTPNLQMKFQMDYIDCRLQAKIGTCIIVDLQIAIERSEGHHMLMSCTRSYGNFIVDSHNILQEDLEGRKIPKTTVKANSRFHMGAGSGGGGGGGGGGQGGAQGAPRNGTNTCRSLITLTMTICDIMNIESSKIMLSDLLHLIITLTIPVTSATAAQNEHFLPCVD